MDFTGFVAKTNVVLLDGAKGTELARRGLVPGGCGNIDAPDAVRDVHISYVRCGCDIITANTLTMNRIYLDRHHPGVDVARVNTAGVTLAREAVKAAGCKDVRVFGEMSSTGQFLEPYGDYTEDAFTEAFAEQARILAEAGADGFIVETMLDLREALCAVKACRTVSARLPLIASLSYSTVAKGCMTVMGSSARDAAARLEAAGADAVGANCGNLIPSEFTEVVKEYGTACRLPILVMPNAGKPEYEEDHKFSIKITPDDFTVGMMSCIEAGARLAGGCCGTSPAHIEALAAALGKLPEQARKAGRQA